MNNSHRTPKRGGRGNFEKPKDFKTSIKRLLKELGKFKVLIIFSLFLASFSAILSIIAPDKLNIIK